MNANMKKKVKKMPMAKTKKKCVKKGSWAKLKGKRKKYEKLLELGKWKGEFSFRFVFNLF